MCGGLAGFAESFMCTPVDLVKCRLQMQKEGHGLGYYKGPIDVLKKVFREEGIKGLYRG
jgi:solute carrier family 25 carnitine/acylcarnitine transporter 20/29